MIPKMLVFGSGLFPSWAILGPSWGHFGLHGPILGHLGATLGLSGPILDHFGAILGPSWAFLGITQACMQVFAQIHSSYCHWSCMQTPIHIIGGFLGWMCNFSTGASGWNMWLIVADVYIWGNTILLFSLIICHGVLVTDAIHILAGGLCSSGDC